LSCVATMAQTTFSLALHEPLRGDLSVGLVIDGDSRTYVLARASPGLELEPGVAELWTTPTPLPLPRETTIHYR
jgi:hypothetical protein